MHATSSELTVNMSALLAYLYGKEGGESAIALDQLGTGIKEVNTKIIDTLSEHFATMEYYVSGNDHNKDNQPDSIEIGGDISMCNDSESEMETSAKLHRHRANKMYNTLLVRENESEPLNVIDLLVTVKAKEQNLIVLAEELEISKLKVQELEKTISKNQKLRMVNEVNLKEKVEELNEQKKKNKLLTHEIQNNKKETVEIFQENQLLQEQIDFAKDKIQELLIDQSKTYEESLIKYQNTLQLVNRLKTEAQNVTNERISYMEDEHCALRLQIDGLVEEIGDLRQSLTQKQTFIKKLLESNIYKISALVDQNLENDNPTNNNTKHHARKGSLNSKALNDSSTSPLRYHNRLPAKQQRISKSRTRADSLPFTEVPLNRLDITL